MNDKTILVTGATDGIGKQTALELARRGARVLLHGRNADKGARAVAEIQRATGSEKITLVLADFARLEEVRALAEEVRALAPRLDVLLHNAGLFMRERELSADGYEMTFAVNHLAPFLLTHLLLDTVKAATPARVVTVASTTHQQARLDFDNLQGEKGYDPYAAYALSKLANVMFALELAERLRGTGVTSNTLHPGVVTTKLLREGYNMSGESVEAGAATSVYLATDPAVAEVTGKYFARERVVPHARTADDAQLRQRLWEVSAEMVGIAPP